MTNVIRIGRTLIAAFVTLCLLTHPAFASELDEKGRIAAAIAAPLRTAEDRSLDASRKPEEYLAFIELSEGDTVAEINAGAGYLARLLPPVVGDTGRVFATNAEFVLELFDGINSRLAVSVRDIPNIEVTVQPDDRVSFPTQLDVAILNNIYHDLHWQKVDIAGFNSSVYTALKPGGKFVVGDHSAPADSGNTRTTDIHRIERDTVIDEIEAAGFVLVETADFLANPKDDRLQHVVYPAIRGKTDRFLLKFERPE